MLDSGYPPLRARLLARGLLPALLAAALASLAAAQPPNDECAGAIAVFDGTNPPATNSGSNTSAPPWTCGAGTNDVWYSYAASCTGIATFSFCSGGTANYDTVIEAFSGSCAALNLLACNDDACSGGRSQLSVPVTAGTVYLVRVGGFGGEVGNFTLGISCSPAALPNDECAGAIPIAEGLNPAGSSVGATTSPPVWACGNGGNDVWFSYSPTCTDNATFSLCSPGFASYDSVLAVYDGACGSLSLLGCNDDACTLSSEVTVPVVAGSTYFVRVGGFTGNTGTFQLNVHHGGVYNYVGTACGAVTLVPSGLPDIGQPVSFDLGGLTGTPAIWAGTPANVPLCPPASCAIGATFDVFLLGSASLAATIPCDPTLVGATVAV
ncbi:MAG: hypothetical protein ACREIU_05800, partial [Planctomycetota bacterium]